MFWPHELDFCEGSSYARNDTFKTRCQGWDKKDQNQFVQLYSIMTLLFMEADLRIEEQHQLPQLQANRLISVRYVQYASVSSGYIY